MPPDFGLPISPSPIGATTIAPTRTDARELRAVQASKTERRFQKSGGHATGGSRHDDDPPKKSAARTLSPTIFHEPWWLEAACDGNYREVIASAGDTVLGRLPYLSRKIAGQTVLTMPAMTHVLGPALYPEIMGAKLPRLTRQISIMADLIGQLPNASYVGFRLHGGLTNTLAFDAAGFSSDVDFTVEISPAEPAVLWGQMRDKTRNVIRRAEEKLEVIELLEPARFMDFYEENLREMGRRNHYNRTICVNIIAECLRRSVGRILLAVDTFGNFKAAIFTVWDCDVEFYFMSTRTPDSPNGATSLLIWTAIQHAALKGLTFDMDFVHVVRNKMPNLLLLTGFGGTIKPRYFVRRTSPLIRMAQYCKNALNSKFR